MSVESLSVGTRSYRSGAKRPLRPSAPWHCAHWSRGDIRRLRDRRRRDLEDHITHLQPTPGCSTILLERSDDNAGKVGIDVHALTKFRRDGRQRGAQFVGRARCLVIFRARFGRAPPGGRGQPLGVERTDLDLDGHLAAVAPDPHFHRLTRVGRRNDAGQGAGLVDRGAAEADDHVAGLEDPRGGAIADHVCDDRALGPVEA